MQINVITQSVGVEEMLGSCTAEQPIDADITLPDYCPDIEPARADGAAVGILSIGAHIHAAVFIRALEIGVF